MPWLTSKLPQLSNHPPTHLRLLPQVSGKSIAANNENFPLIGIVFLSTHSFWTVVKFDRVQITALIELSLRSLASTYLVVSTYLCTLLNS